MTAIKHYAKTHQYLDQFIGELSWMTNAELQEFQQQLADRSAEMETHESAIRSVLYDNIADRIVNELKIMRGEENPNK